MKSPSSFSLVRFLAFCLLWTGLSLATPPALLVAAGNTVELRSRVTDPGVREVIVVFKTHFDIGYTDMASNIVAKYRTAMIDQALAVVDDNRELPPEQQFVWTLPGWPMTKITEDWPGQNPRRQQRVMQAFKEGRFVVHALPFTLHTELLELEDLVRGLRSSSPEVPRLFWWEGPDGSRLLTFYSAHDYGTGLMPPSDWPHRTWLALIHTGDNHGPPRPDEVKRLLDEAKDQLPGVKVRIGRLSDFADALLAEQPDLPVVRGDMPDTWIHGPMADPRGARLARNLRPALATTELLGTQLEAWGVRVSEIAATLADAYEQSLLYGEHTWGGAFWWIYGKYVLKFGDEWQAERAAGRFARIESSWDEHTAYIEEVQRLVQPALAGGMQALAEAVKVAGRRIVVFNPLPWTRDGVVTVAVPGATGVLIDAVTGQAVPADPLESDQVRFVARDLPPGGYKTFFLAPTPSEASASAPFIAQGHSIENDFFKLSFDPRRGVMTSWLDKRTGRELVDGAAPWGFGQYLYERFDRDQVRGFVKAYVKIDADWGINELGKPSLPSSTERPYRAGSPAGFRLRLEAGEP